MINGDRIIFVTRYTLISDAFVRAFKGRALIVALYEVGMEIPGGLSGIDKRTDSAGGGAVKRTAIEARPCHVAGRNPDDPLFLTSGFLPESSFSPLRKSRGSGISAIPAARRRRWLTRYVCNAPAAPEDHAATRRALPDSAVT